MSCLKPSNSEPNSCFQLEKEYVEWVRDIRGMRFELSEKFAMEGAGSRQQTEVLDLCKIVDVDGEVIPLSAPKFDVRYCSLLSLSLSLSLSPKFEIRIAAFCLSAPKFYIGYCSTLSVPTLNIGFCISLFFQI